jgi:hypothetical protein
MVRDQKHFRSDDIDAQGTTQSAAFPAREIYLVPGDRTVTALLEFCQGPAQRPVEGFRMPRTAQSSSQKGAGIGFRTRREIHAQRIRGSSKKE